MTARFRCFGSDPTRRVRRRVCDLCARGGRDAVCSRDHGAASVRRPRRLLQRRFRGPPARPVGAAHVPALDPQLSARDRRRDRRAARRRDLRRCGDRVVLHVPVPRRRPAARRPEAGHPAGHDDLGGMTAVSHQHHRSACHRVRRLQSPRRPSIRSGPRTSSSTERYARGRRHRDQREEGRRTWPRFVRSCARVHSGAARRGRVDRGAVLERGGASRRARRADRTRDRRR